MPVDDDLRAKLRRFVGDLDAENEAKKLADEALKIRRRDFVMAFRTKMKKVVEPALEAVCEELREAGFDIASLHPLTAADAVMLSLGGRGSLTYQADVGEEWVYVVIAAKRMESAHVSVDELTPNCVKRHVEAFIQAAEGKPLGLGWAGPG